VAKLDKTKYRRLDPAKIISTADKLRDRVGERFPASGLCAVAAELSEVGRDTAKRAKGFAGPYFGLRLLTAFVVLSWLTAQVWVVQTFDLHRLASADPLTLAQGVESAVQLFLLLAAGVWFLLSFEERLKRRRVQGWLHELRAFAHVIDMHQLTKDPTVILNPGPRTASSPERAMTRFELARYLEYCAEMFSITGKLSAVYAGATKDAVVVAAAGDVENLCTDLGRKVWQKIMILSDLDEASSG
jgi:hypothetical protein